MSLPRNPKIEIEKTRTLFTGRIFDLVQESVRLPSGKRQDLVVVDHPGAVAIAALDARGEMLLVRQYRHATGDWLIEIPAGRLEKNETTPGAAERELEEETGYRAHEWRRLCEFYTAPGFCSERMTVFLARTLELARDRRPADDDEEIELLRAAPREVLSGSLRTSAGVVPIADAKTLLAAALVCELTELDRARPSS